MSPPVIREENPDQPEVKTLLAASNAYMAELYPAESNHMLDIGELLGPETTFLVARIGGHAVGCAALIRKSQGYGELKRMFVAEEARGYGLGRTLLEAIEKSAKAVGISLLRLETGILQQESIGLYRAAGFSDIPPFGDYAEDPLSLFMEKNLDV